MTNRKGPDFERVMADWFKAQWSRVIDRKVKTGVRDKGDVANFYIHGHALTIECKNLASYDLAGAIKEAEVESVNDASLAGIAVIKRKGKAHPKDQFVVMTAETFITVLKAAMDVQWHPTDEQLYGRWCPGDQSWRPGQPSSETAAG